jgi:triphosphoribosyl-dephospho-CoA synthetase
MTRLDFWARPCGECSGEKMGPNTRGGLFAQNLPAKVGLGLLPRWSLCRLPGERRSLFARTGRGQLPASSESVYLAFALAAAAVMAEGSAKAITASPS